MTKIATLFVGAALALAAAGSSAAHAAVRFTNISNHPIVFTMRCAGDREIDRWVVGAHRILPLTCNNGEPLAAVRVITRTPWGIHVVRQIVRDGWNYELYFNNLGEATIASA